VTIAAEHVGRWLHRLLQIRARASVTVETAGETRVVDEVVMAGDANRRFYDYSCGKLHATRAVPLQAAADENHTVGVGQRQQNDGRDTAGTTVDSRRVRIRAHPGRKA